MPPDYYSVLGVSRDATTNEIKKAFRRIARETHPDANPDDPVLEQRFRDAAEAYEVLSDPERRRRYDRGDTIDLTSLFSGSGGLEDLLASVFGDGGLFGNAPRRPTRGRDVLVRTEISLEEAAFGSNASVSFQTRTSCAECSGTGAAPGAGEQTCPDCNGAGSVRMARRSVFGSMMTVTTCPRCDGEGRVIVELCPVCSGVGSVPDVAEVTVEVPAGITSGTRLRLSGRGEAAGRSGRAGDLFVEVLVRPSNVFERVEDDLVVQRQLGIAEATLGTVLSVPLIGGGETNVQVPPGTQPGTVITVPNEGMTRLGRGTRGDLHVVVSVAIPESLTDDERELLSRWADLRGERTGDPTKTN